MPAPCTSYAEHRGLAVLTEYSCHSGAHMGQLESELMKVCVSVCIRVNEANVSFYLRVR